jgi:hypothetical protein
MFSKTEIGQGAKCACPSAAIGDARVYDATGVDEFSNLIYHFNVLRQAIMDVVALRKHVISWQTLIFPFVQKLSKNDVRSIERG